MPLIKRNIEPVNLSRTLVAPGIKNELECVTNTTLANVIRQLSSLSKHAENIFGELFYETNSFLLRANQLQERVDRLKVKVTQLDSTVEEVSLQDINLRKPFRSSVIKDQQIITLATRPSAISESYSQCDAPPPLDKLNPYREDGKDSMKFYTDPQYFFELWCLAMQKDAERQRNQIHKKKRKTYHSHHDHHNRPRAPQQKVPIRAPKNRYEEYQKLARGREFVTDAEIGRNQGSQGNRPNSLELQQNVVPYTQLGDHYATLNHTGSTAHSNSTAPVIRRSSIEQSAGRETPSYQPQDNPAEYEHKPSNAYTYMDGRQESPQRTPTKHTPGSRAPSSSIYSPRPTQPPPAPPGSQNTKVDSPLGNLSGSGNRVNLPPPPPPPPCPAPGSVAENHVTGPVATAYMNGIGQRQSPIRVREHTQSPQFPTKSSTPDSMELPPPPPSPPLPHTPGTPSSMPPPPPTPPPPEPAYDHMSVHPPPPPSPPPPPPPMINTIKDDIDKVPNGRIPQAPPGSLMPPLDSVSMTSNVSSTESSGSTMKSDEADPKQPMMDTRSDLLSAIRTGINLRKVEERRLKDEQKHRPSSRLDVQSIMEAAFELRRKALEVDDSSGEEEEEEVDNNEWE